MKLLNLTLATITVAVVVTVFFNKSLADSTSLESDEDKFSYAIGTQVGQQLKQSMQDDINPQVLTDAIRDVLTNSELALNEEQVFEALEKKQAEEDAEHQKLVKENVEKANLYFETNKAKDGVVVTETGIQYEVIQASSQEDAKSPELTSNVEVHYHGTLLDGTVFDSSVDRGETIVFPVNGVIQGWQEILPMMKEGDKWKVSIPAELAYGEQSPSPIIGPNAALIFDIELIKILDSQ